MAIYAFGDRTPVLHPDAYVHPEATVIGNVTVGAEATIWPGVVLRGDSGRIVIGAQTSIQDGSIIHCTPEHPTLVGDRCVVGHLVHLEGCTVEDDALVGNGSIVLHGAVVRSWALVGSGAVVPDGMEVPGGTMALGIPAKLRERDSRDQITSTVEIYRARGHEYRSQLRRVD